MASSSKFHINDAGEVGACKASIKECKFTSNGESVGTETGHYTSREEAIKGSEDFLEKKHKDVYKSYRKGVTDGGDFSDSLKKRLIKESEAGEINVSPATIGRFLSKDKNELIRKTVAETLTSQKLLRDMSDDESARVRKAVAMRTNNRDVLAKLAKDEDGTVRHAAINNQKTPSKARKAAKSAIKEANIKNLAKARTKEATAAA